MNRVSLGAQSFQPGLLEVLDRVAGPDDVRRAVYLLRDAGFDNISLDLIYGIPGQSAAEVERDLAEALALEPEHLSAYELEAKPGTRFTHAHGAELERQAESMESYFELVVETLTGAGYRWYETANFCRAASGDGTGGARSALASQPRLLARARLPRPRRGRGQHNRESALAERAVDPRATSRRSRRVGARPGSRRSSPTRCARPSASCSGFGSTSRSRSPRHGLDRRELERLERLGLVSCAGASARRRRRFGDRRPADGGVADGEGALPRRRRDGAPARLSGSAAPLQRRAGPRLR